MRRISSALLALAMLCSLALSGCKANGPVSSTAPAPTAAAPAASYDLSSLPDYGGSPYVAVNDNVPYFTEEDYTTNSFESYSDLDQLGRCGVVYACVGTDLMPTEERGSIGQVKPSGWQTVKYDCVDGKYLYNRCHLIGFQLTGENANEKNLITGTRYLNVDGMLPFENLVSDYVQETDHHVLYRVTPVFEGDNLVASGVLMEGWSVEDGGEGVTFCVYAYNVQPGITIDYATGASAASGEDLPQASAPAQTTSGSEEETQQYVLNTSSMKFHEPDCSGVASMSDANRQDYTGSRQDLIDQGYAPCGICKP